MSQQKRKLYRIHLLLSLSLVYGCQGTPSSSLGASNSAPKGDLLLSPASKSGPVIRTETGWQVQALTPEDLQELWKNPLLESNQRFALKLYLALAEEKKAQNFFVSPLGISLVLQMAWNGARNQTRSEMAKVLEIEGLNPEQINRGAQLLMRKLYKPASDIQLEMVNGIFANDRFEILPDFITKNQTHFAADVRLLKFKNGPTQTEINAWVNENTNGRIPELLSVIRDTDEAEKWENSTLMYLINALYFKAHWHEQFLAFETKLREFTLVDGTKKQVPMMRQFGEYDYLMPNHPELKNQFQAIELVYGDRGKIGLYLFLPSYDRTLIQMQKELAQLSFQKVFFAFELAQGSISLPKFKQSHFLDLSQLLISLGMKQAFEPALADFYAMAKPRFEGEKFAISEAFQKTFIEINEEGTEASAASALRPTAQPSSEPLREIEMIVDRPFMYLIRDNDTGQILFMGNVYDPSVET